jgi:hypothetical protein
MNQKIVSHQQRLDNLFQRISTIQDPYYQSEWSKYLCILVSGFIEESLRVLLEEYSYKHASSNILNFVASEIQDITNCNSNKIAKILGKFSSNWETDFVSQIQAKSKKPDEIKNSIDSIVATRNQIAHGKSAGITYTKVSDYYENVKIAIEILDNIIK